MDRQRVDGIIRGIEDARAALLDYEPPWIDPGYEEVRARVDRTLRQVQLAIGAFLDDVPVIAQA
jgi:hypothetical protein